MALASPLHCHKNALHISAGCDDACTAASWVSSQLILISSYPNAPSVALATGDGCWDVSSNSTLTRFGGGDSFAIYEMTEYTIRKYHADRARVFVTGVSSGAMMTNVLLATYPDVYKAGSAFAGVAFGCFADPQGPPDTWSDACATGKVIKTPQQWGAEVRNAYPEYRGIRPKIQLWHGTNDTTLYPQNLQEEIKQWTDVFRISQRPTAVQENLLQETWVGERYGEGEVEVVIETGQTHNLVVLPNEGMN